MMRGRVLMMLLVCLGGKTLFASPTDVYCSKPSGASTEIKVTNNCSSGFSVYMTAAAYGATQGIPNCLANMAQGAEKSLYLPPDNAGYALYQATDPNNPGCSGPPGSGCAKTRFEITIPPGANPIISWDVSANDGWDVGMTIVTPQNTDGPTLLIAKDANAPGIYPIPSASNPCAVQPCYSNAWNNNVTTQPYYLYFCNRETDTANTPGKCGCEVCPGTECSPASSTCTTSGSGIYCSTVCPANIPSTCATANWANPPAECTQLCPKN